MQMLLYANLWRPISLFYSVLKRLQALGVCNRKCEHPHKLAMLNHCVVCISI